FPRIDLKEAVASMRALEEQVTAEQNALLGKKPAETAVPSGSEKITIDDVMKVDLRVGLVKFAERVKNSDKLMHMKVDIGEAEPRTIVAGIAEAYTPEQLLNRQVVIVANLQPRKLKGIESNGMIVAASVEGGKPVLAAGVELMMAIGTGGLLDVAIQQAERYPFIYATIGVHPHDAAKATPDTWARLRDLAGHPKVLAIGEIGLDYHYDFSPRDVQRSVF